MLITIVDAKSELLKAVGKMPKSVKIKCAFVNEYDLPIGYNAWELSNFFDNLNIYYNPAETEIFGVVWFENGSFIERIIEKNCQYWKLNAVPIIPPRLKQPKP